jgi:hypothetical protein
VNRPFCAFGALLAFLVLAMFAVSSTSRSTTVGAARPTGKVASTMKNRQRINCAPAPAADAADCAGGEDGSAVAGRCGWSQANEQLISVRTGKVAPTRMLAARVEIAENLQAAWPALLTLDCRSHSDKAYDRLIYGETDDDIPLVRRIDQRMNEEPKAPDGEWLTVFRSLVVAERNSSPPPQAGASVRQSRCPCSVWSSAMATMSLGHGILGPSSDWTQLRTLIISVRSWLTQRISQLVRPWNVSEPRAAAGSTPPLNWDEYAELIDRASGTVSATAVPTGTSGVGRSVRFGGWLRHSAASSLYQLGSLLQAAGLALDREGRHSTVQNATGVDH